MTPILMSLAWYEMYVCGLGSTVLPADESIVNLKDPEG